MAAIILDPSVLRRAYRDTINILPDIVLYRKTVDEGIAAKLYYFYIKSWKIGQDAVKLRYEYLY